MPSRYLSCTLTLMCFLFILSRDEREMEKMEEYDWAVHQVMTLRAMEQAEYEEKALREAQDMERYGQLRQQIEEQRQNRNEWNKTKYGSIDQGFFNGFGQSCR